MSVCKSFFRDVVSVDRRMFDGCVDFILDRGENMRSAASLKGFKKAVKHHDPRVTDKMKVDLEFAQRSSHRDTHAVADAISFLNVHLAGYVDLAPENNKERFTCQTWKEIYRSVMLVLWCCALGVTSNSCVSQGLCYETLLFA